MAHDFGLQQPQRAPTAVRNPTDRLAARVRREGERVNPRTDRDAGRGLLSLPLDLGSLPNKSALSENPLGSIGRLLRDTTAPLQGRKGGHVQRFVDAREKRDFRRQALHEKRVATSLDAVAKFFAIIKGRNETDARAAAENFNSIVGEISGIDFQKLVSVTPVDAEKLVAAGRGIDPAFIPSDPAAAFKALRGSDRNLMERLTDDKHASAVFDKVVNLVSSLGKRLSPEQREELLKDGITMNEIAGLGVLTPLEEAVLRRLQSSMFPELSKKTGLNFVSGDALEEAEKADATRGPQNLIAMEDEDGNFVGSFRKDDPAIDALTKMGAREAPSRQQIETTGPTELDKVERREIRREVGVARNAIRSLDEVLPQIDEDTVGIWAWLSVNIGGPAQQIPVVGAIADAVGGAVGLDKETVDKAITARNSFMFEISQLANFITRKGRRLSNEDRTFAKQASGLLDHRVTPEAAIATAERLKRIANEIIDEQIDRLEGGDVRRDESDSGKFTTRQTEGGDIEILDEEGNVIDTLVKQ